MASAGLALIGLSVAAVSDKSDCAVVFREGRVAGHHGGPLVAAIPAESFLEFLRMYVPVSEHFLTHWEGWTKRDSGEGEYGSLLSTICSAHYLFLSSCCVSMINRRYHLF